METDFLKVIFSDEYRILLNGPEVGFFMEIVDQHDLKDKQEGGVMFWDSIGKVTLIVTPM